MSTTDGPNGLATLTVEDGVAELRLDNPDRKNVFSPGLGEDVMTHLLAVEDDESIAALVLTAAGDVFCAGLDLDVVTGEDEDAVHALLDRLDAVRRWLASAPVPVIVGATGAAPGAGAVLIAHTDIRVLGEGTRLWWPEVRLGLRAYHETVNLAAAVGLPKATELMLLGEDAALSADEARRLGFANRVVDPDEVDATVREMAATVATRDAAHGQIREYTEVLRHARREQLSGSEQFARERASEFSP